METHGQLRLNRITFRNFRNLEHVELNPGPGVNVISGENGQGKTNLLEGIYLFAHLKSFRGAGNADLLGPAGEAGRIVAACDCRSLRHELQLDLTREGRRFLLDGKVPRPMEQLLDAVRAILFAPDELQQLRTQPAARRSLLDRAIFQLEPAYLGQAVEYERILRQRNRLLKERSGEELLAPWDAALIRSGSAIRRARTGFIASLAPYLRTAHAELVPVGHEVRISYPGGTGSETDLAEELERARGRERRLLQSCAGPHRDDPLFLLNEQTVRHHASQGEWRTIVLAFKTALLRLLRDRLGFSPILLLDDIAAELDLRRQGQLFDLLAGCGAQVFVTTTDPKPMQRINLPEVCWYTMQSGRLSPAQSD